MMDIIDIVDGQDLVLRNSDIMKAANVLSVQLESLEYLPTWGVDLAYFLNDEVMFQTEVLRGYFVQRLTESSISVSSILETMSTFDTTYNIQIEGNQNYGGLIG